MVCLQAGVVGNVVVRHRQYVRFATVRTQTRAPQRVNGLHDVRFRL